jgi:hypothetical protein
VASAQTRDLDLFLRLLRRLFLGLRIGLTAGRAQAVA